MAPLAMGVDMAAHMGAATVVPTAVLILALEDTVEVDSEAMEVDMVVLEVVPMDRPTEVSEQVDQGICH